MVWEPISVSTLIWGKAALVVNKQMNKCRAFISQAELWGLKVLPRHGTWVTDPHWCCAIIVSLLLLLQDSLAKNFYKELSRLNCFEAYHRCDHEYCQFKNYNLTFTSYLRPPALPPRWELPLRHNPSTHPWGCCRPLSATSTGRVDVADATVMASSRICRCPENKHIKFSHVTPCVRHLVVVMKIVFEWTSVHAKRKLWFKFGQISTKPTWLRWPIIYRELCDFYVMILISIQNHVWKLIIMCISHNFFDGILL